MRDDHKLALKKVKQQVLAFCLRHGCHYDGTKNHWTRAHIDWLRTLIDMGFDYPDRKSGGKQKKKQAGKGADVSRLL